MLTDAAERHAETTALIGRLSQSATQLEADIAKMTAALKTTRKAICVAKREQALLAEVLALPSSEMSPTPADPDRAPTPVDMPDESDDRLGKDKPWAELTPTELVAAAMLGFDELKWDAGGAFPPVFQQPWVVLSSRCGTTHTHTCTCTCSEYARTHAHAIMLLLPCVVNHRRQQEHAKSLGYTEESWSSVDATPDDAAEATGGDGGDALKGEEAAADLFGRVQWTDRLVVLHKPTAASKLGLVLASDGGATSDPPHVKEIKPNGLAAAAITTRGVPLHVDDFILAVNDEEVHGHSRATYLLQTAVGDVRLRVYACEALDDAANPSSPTPTSEEAGVARPSSPREPRMLGRQFIREPSEASLASLELQAINEGVPSTPAQLTRPASAASKSADAAAGSAGLDNLAAMNHAPATPDNADVDMVERRSPPKLAGSFASSWPDAGLYGKCKAWRDLALSEIAAAVQLGYTQATWDDGETPPACMQPWEKLSSLELKAAKALGYSHAEWDAELDASMYAETSHLIK